MVEVLRKAVTSQLKFCLPRPGAKQAVLEHPKDEPTIRRHVVDIEDDFQSSAGAAANEVLERLVKNDYFGLYDDAARGEFPRIVAEVYPYRHTCYTYTNNGTAYWRIPTSLGYAASALQLSKDTDPVMVYLRHGMPSDLVHYMGPGLSSRVTMAIRFLLQKTIQHRHHHPHLYVETVLKSEAEDVARVLAQGCHAHPQNAKFPTFNQPIPEKKSCCNIIGCPKELLSPDSTAGNIHRALHAEFLDSLQTPAQLSTKHGMLSLPFR